MMQYDRITLGRLAKELGFVRDTLEKVCRLADVLAFMEKDPLLRKCVAFYSAIAAEKKVTQRIKNTKNPIKLLPCSIALNTRHPSPDRHSSHGFPPRRTLRPCLPASEPLSQSSN